jgi:phosphohistidine phosphatase
VGVIAGMTQTDRMHLWLLRHAKSSWDEPQLDDRDRPLAPRGERSADLMSDYVRTQGIRPDVVLCSSALRTRQTLARVLPALGPDVEIHIEPALYTFDAGSLLERVRAIPDGVSAMLIGHNPAMQELAIRLASRGDRLDTLAQKFPTGALAELEFPAGSWHEIGKTGELTRFVVPRELD